MESEVQRAADAFYAANHCELEILIAMDCTPDRRMARIRQQIREAFQAGVFYQWSLISRVSDIR